MSKTNTGKYLFSINELNTLLAAVKFIQQKKIAFNSSPITRDPKADIESIKAELSETFNLYLESGYESQVNRSVSNLRHTVTEQLVLKELYKTCSIKCNPTVVSQKNNSSKSNMDWFWPLFTENLVSIIPMLYKAYCGTKPVDIKKFTYDVFSPMKPSAENVNNFIAEMERIGVLGPSSKNKNTKSATPAAKSPQTNGSPTESAETESAETKSPRPDPPRDPPKPNPPRPDPPETRSAETVTPMTSPSRIHNFDLPNSLVRSCREQTKKSRAPPHTHH